MLDQLNYRQGQFVEKAAQVQLKCFLQPNVGFFTKLMQFILVIIIK